MPKSIRAIFNWGMLSLFLFSLGGYYINELSSRFDIYIIIVLLIYIVSSISYIREKLDMIRVEREIDLIIYKKDKNHKMKRL